MIRKEKLRRGILETAKWFVDTYYDFLLDLLTFVAGVRAGGMWDSFGKNYYFVDGHGESIYCQTDSPCVETIEFHAMSPNMMIAIAFLVGFKCTIRCFKDGSNYL